MPAIDPVFIVQIALILVVFTALLLSAAAMVWAERKVAARLQQRFGPTMAGPAGLLQPFADVLKLFFKEELRPSASDAVLFYIAPVISATTAFLAFCVVPFGPPTTLFGLLDRPVPLYVADVNVAILVVFAVASMGVYGIVLAGWSSNSKYSLLGGLRSSAQMISYELSYGMALASVLLVANSLSLQQVVNSQAGYWHLFGLPVAPRWLLFVQPIGFLIFMTAGVAETNRAPFDFPEAEQELVAGYHTEYFEHELRPVLPGGVHQHGHRVGRGDEPVPGGMAPAAPARVPGHRVVVREALGAPVLLLVDPVDAAALPVRPADAVRLEDPASSSGRQPAAHRSRSAVPWALNTVFFYVFGALAVGASLLVIGQRNPIHSVLLLIVSFAALSGLYILLDSPFAAVTQMIVYAGAIMVLFLFVVMLLNVPREDAAEWDRGHPLNRPGARRLGAGLSALLVAELVWAVWHVSTRQTAALYGSAAGDVSSVAAIGRSIFTDYAFPFEATSVLILAAMVGAVILARREQE